MCTDGSLGDGITYLKAIGGWCRGPGIVARQSPPFLLPQLPKHFKKLLLRLSLSSSRHNTRWIHISNKLNVSFYLTTSNSPIAKLEARQRFLFRVTWKITFQDGQNSNNYFEATIGKVRFLYSHKKNLAIFFSCSFSLCLLVGVHTWAMIGPLLLGVKFFVALVTIMLESSWKVDIFHMSESFVLISADLATRHH